MTYFLFFNAEFPYYCMIQFMTDKKSVNTNSEEDTHLNNFIKYDIKRNAD
jgi:hypothetical protein